MKINDNDSDKLKEYKAFLNDICADRKPEFFKHRYYQSKQQNNDYQNSFNLYSEIMYSANVDGVEEIKKQYDSNQVLLPYDSVMNKLCAYLEKTLQPIKKQGLLVNHEVAKLLKTNIEPLIDYEKINYVKALVDEYYDNKRQFRLGLNQENVSIDHVAKILREKAVERFADSEELANYVVEVCYIQRYHNSKSFAWNVFGQMLTDNLRKNTNEKIYVPVKDKCGEIEYLFNKYHMTEVIEEENS